MKTEEEKKLDDIFSKGLQHPNDHSPYVEDDWGAMEAMLDKHKRRPAIIYWLPVLAGVAALLLVVIGWWLLKPAAPQHPVQQIASQIKKQSNSVDTVERIAKRSDTSERLIAKQNSDKDETKPAKEGSSVAQPLLVAKPNMQKPATVKNYAAIAPQIAKQTTNYKSVVTNPAVKSPDTVMLAQNASKPNSANTNGPIVNAAVDVPRADNVTANPAANTVAANTTPKPGTDVASNKIKLKRAVMAYRPQFALSVLGSTDINGVGSFQGGSQGKGNTVGLLFSVGVSKRFTFSTGAVYSSKPYITGFNNYHTAYQFPTDPLNVKADCRVLDIPLNVDYSLFGNYRNKLSIGTGLSSYIMLREHYQYNYANTYVTGPASYTVPNTNKYFLGVLNLQATYQRQLNSKFGLSVQPFMKLPLTNIGAGQVKLQTTGVALGITWNLNSTSNP